MYIGYKETAEPELGMIFSFPAYSCQVTVYLSIASSGCPCLYQCSPVPSQFQHWAWFPHL